MFVTKDAFKLCVYLRNGCQHLISNCGETCLLSSTSAQLMASNSTSNFRVASVEFTQGFQKLSLLIFIQLEIFITSRNDSSNSSTAVSELRRDSQSAFLTDTHVGQSLVPALDYLSSTEGKLERFLVDTKMKIVLQKLFDSQALKLNRANT